MDTRRLLIALSASTLVWVAACESKAPGKSSPTDTGTGTGGDITTTGGTLNTGGVTVTGSGGVAASGGVTATGGKTTGTGGAPVVDAGLAGTSAGCGKAGAATGVLNDQSITVGTRARTYVLSVPKSYSPSTPMPLIFAWHGFGGSGRVARQYFGVEAASQSGAIFVYPDGLPVNDAGSAGWDLANTGIDFAFFDALLAAVPDAYCVDRTKVFSVGHSYGGMMTNTLGCFRGDVLRAIAPVAGMPPNAYGGRTPACVGNVGAMIVHGENDATVDYTRGGIGGRDFWASQNGCSTANEPMTSAGCVASTGCRADLPVAFCVHNQGHDFPNGRCDASACVNGGQAIWAFFKSFN